MNVNVNVNANARIYRWALLIRSAARVPVGGRSKHVREICVGREPPLTWNGLHIGGNPLAGMYIGVAVPGTTKSAL